MRARLTRGNGLTRADRGLDNPRESGRTTLPVLLTVDEAADLLRTTRRAGRSTSGSSHLTTRGSSGSANARRCRHDRPLCGGLKVANACCSSD